MSPVLAFKKFQTLQAKFLFFVIPPVIGCFLLFSVLQTFLSYQERKEDILENLNSHANIQSAILAKSLWGVDFDLARIQVASMLLNPSISGIRVVEFTTETIIDNGYLPTKIDERGYFHAKHPIIYILPTGEQHIGELTVVAEKSSIYVPLFYSLLRDTFLLLILLIVIVASAVTANRLIIGRPLKLFLAAIQRADKENDRQQVDWYAQDELGTVIRAYNKLLVNLSEAERAEKESEEKFRNVVERANDGIIIIQEENISYANFRAAEIAGYSVTELLKFPIAKFISKEELPRVLNYHHLRLNGKDMPNTYETEVLHKNGNKVPVEVNAAALTLHGVRSNLVILRDISRRKKAEKDKKKLSEKLQQARSMEAVGLMAGGVAHDLNNILSGVVGYPELMLQKLSKDSELRIPLEAIKESGTRAATVVADLLTVAKGAASTREIHDINSLVLGYLDSPECKKLKSLYPKVTYQHKFNTVRPHILCSPVHVKKCLMNLVTNAGEAIPGEGAIVISTESQYVDGAAAAKNNMKPGEFIMLKVQDNGHGISEENLKHIFEPFYTKKVMGRSGTGLGLTVVWSTMENHGGKIIVTSSDLGTCFQLFFPVTKETLVAQVDNVSTENLAGNSEYILVVDDEPHLRDIARQMLLLLGYKVDSVSSGELAIEFVTKKHVDLIVLDMLMNPGIDGRQTYEEIIKLYPNQKAIITSGFSESADVKAVLRLGVGGFVKKPYSTNQLGRAVKEALNG